MKGRLHRGELIREQERLWQHGSMMIAGVHPGDDGSWMGEVKAVVDRSGRIWELTW